MLVPIHVQDSVGISNRRQLLLAHPPHAHSSQHGAAQRQRPGDPLVAHVPAHRTVVPAHRPIKADPRKESVRPEGRQFLVDGPVIHRQHDHRHGVRHQQDRGHGDGLVIEKLPGQTVQEDQRDEHRTGRQHRREHRPAHFHRALHDSAAQRLAPLPAGGDVVRQHNGVVHHHAHAQQQAGQGDDINRKSDGIEHEERHHQRHRDRQRHQQRRTQVFHEEEDDHDVQQDGQEDVQQQVTDGIVQQRRLVARQGEAHLRIILPEGFQLLGNPFAERGHPGLALLDHGQRHGILPVAAREARAGCRPLRHRRHILHLERPVPHLQPHVGDILARRGEGAETDVVVVLPVPDRQVRERHVGRRDRPFERRHRQAQPCERLWIRDHQDLPLRSPAQVHHRHLRQLLDALRDHVAGEFAHPKEIPAPVA